MMGMSLLWQDKIANLMERLALSPAWTYTLTLPTPLAENGTVQIVLETVQTKATRAWPAEAGQTDPQVLRFESDLLVLSPYGTVVQRTKIKYVPSFSRGLATLVQHSISHFESPISNV
jgi:hypothetical protein